MKNLILTMALGLGFMHAAYADVNLTLNNQSPASAAVAFAYLDQSSGQWKVEGWYNVDANGSTDITLPTNNSVFYLYGEFSNRRRTSAGADGVKLQVTDQPFAYFREQGLSGEGVRTERFMRSGTNSSGAVINLH